MYITTYLLCCRNLFEVIVAFLSARELHQKKKSLIRAKKFAKCQQLFDTKRHSKKITLPTFSTSTSNVLSKYQEATKKPPRLLVALFIRWCLLCTVNHNQQFFLNSKSQLEKYSRLLQIIKQVVFSSRIYKQNSQFWITVCICLFILQWAAFFLPHISKCPCSE